MKNAEEFRSQFVKISKLLLSLCSVAFLIFSVAGVISIYRVETHRINLTQFTGRIIPADNIRPGTFTIQVPISEALKYGKDAILSYGKEGIKIWKPDNSTSGVFLYSAIITYAVDFRAYKVCRTDKEIVLHSFTPVVGYIQTILFLLLVIVVNIGTIMFTVKEFKS